MDTKRGMTTILRRPLPKDASNANAAEAVRVKEPLSIVIFGASGDLAHRKLIPALFHLHAGGFLPERFAIVGFSRTPMSDEAFRENIVKSLREVLGKEAPGDLANHPVVKALHYVAGNNDDAASFTRLKEKLVELDISRQLGGNRLFYLSVTPGFFPVIVRQLGEAGLIAPRFKSPWTRVIVEKPFGRDLASAQKLNDELGAVLDESQIYRIDHYLGKETVQNILSFRFGNAIFEPLFNNKYVDHVQITVAETLGMEGKRGAYYDTAGATRDMLQNHMLQLLTLVAMEPPPVLDANSIRGAKVLLLRSLQPFNRDLAAKNTVRGQYGAGTDKDGKQLKGYRQEENVPPDSLTETYVALKVKIDNWRWAGVPFYLRTGKRLPDRRSEIAVTFKRPPMSLFPHNRDTDYCLMSANPVPNELVLHIQPKEGISLSMACKQPGMQMVLDEVDMDFEYEEAFEQRSPEAYERLLLDAMRGDASLFTRVDEVFQAWSFVNSLQSAWAELPPPAFPNYAPFGDGPADAMKLVNADGTCWRPIRARERQK
ncbi:MAG TPA: glucose-6-phosphate dehydrogenase [Planctomycetota bacterium]|nr:glucose-6-phosphate dehydrogenase [Planctomycetota bacterium]